MVMVRSDIMRVFEYFKTHRNAIYIGIFCVLIISIVFIWLLYSQTLADMNHPFIKNTTFSTLKLDEEAYGNTEFNSDRISFRTILDKDVENNFDNVIYISFRVGGNKDNDAVVPTYDIALQDLKVDCDLLSPYLKWKLLKNGEELSHGSFDYKFDTIKDGRLVLTPIQQDLVSYQLNKNEYDYYQFYLWLSDSCQEEDISLCNDVPTQENLLGKKLSGKIEVELYSQAKNDLVRSPKEELDTSTCILENGNNDNE